MNRVTGLSNDWYEHGSTKKVLADLEKQVEIQTTALYSACRKSSDPEVVRRHAELMQLNDFVKQLRKEGDHGRADGDDD